MRANEAGSSTITPQPVITEDAAFIARNFPSTASPAACVVKIFAYPEFSEHHARGPAPVNRLSVLCRRIRKHFFRSNIVARVPRHHERGGRQVRGKAVTARPADLERIPAKAGSLDLRSYSTFAPFSAAARSSLCQVVRIFEQDRSADFEVGWRTLDRIDVILCDQLRF